MVDDLRLRGPADRDRVNVHEPWELYYWSNHFGCTPDRLRVAVTRVGPMRANVERDLRG